MRHISVSVTVMRSLVVVNVLLIPRSLIFSSQGINARVSYFKNYRIRSICYTWQGSKMMNLLFEKCGIVTRRVWIAFDFTSGVADVRRLLNWNWHFFWNNLHASIFHVLPALFLVLFSIIFFSDKFFRVMLIIFWKLRPWILVC